MSYRQKITRVSTVAAIAVLSVTAIACGPTRLARASAITNPAGSTPSAFGEHLIKRAHAEGLAHSVTDYTSKNWAGYFATTASHGTDFTAISAQWVEPGVICNSKNSWVAFWVGMDGWWDHEVEQGGSEAHCVDGIPSYNVWWEMFPYNSIQTSFTIQPGDTIQASVTYVMGTKMFDILVKDLTNGQTLTKDITCQKGQAGCARTSAEVISEDVGGGNGPDGLYYLPDYSAANYISISVTDINGQSGTLSDPSWQLGDVAEVSSNGITKQTASELYADGASFYTAWQTGGGGLSWVAFQAPLPSDEKPKA